MPSLQYSKLKHITTNEADEHLFEIYTAHRLTNQDEQIQSLGYISQENEITVTIGPSKQSSTMSPALISTPSSIISSNSINFRKSKFRKKPDLTSQQYEIKQNIPQFKDTNSNQGSTTGFVAWSSSVHLVNWLLYGDTPFEIHGKVIELGSGISGILAMGLLNRVSLFIASDHLHGINKLFEHNVLANCQGEFVSRTIDCRDTNPNKKNGLSVSKTGLEIVLYDWELSTTNEIENLLEFKKPDFIISCDTVYNSYLIEPLLNSIYELSGNETNILIAIQLREFSVMEDFISQALRKFDVWYVRGECLSLELINGYAVYCLRKL